MWEWISTAVCDIGKISLQWECLSASNIYNRCISVGSLFTFVSNLVETTKFSRWEWIRVHPFPNMSSESLHISSVEASTEISLIPPHFKKHQFTVTGRKKKKGNEKISSWSSFAETELMMQSTLYCICRTWSFYSWGHAVQTQHIHSAPTSDIKALP